MSKIGRNPRTIPSGVTVTVTDQQIVVKGGKGELSHTLPRQIHASLTENVLTFTRDSEDKPVKALHGLSRALVANMVEGVSSGFKKTLELVGTGYRARMQGDKLVLSLGYSHEIEFPVPQGIAIAVEGTNLVHISGYDKQAVGQVAAVIREFRKPEPYKGKGVRYQGEVVRRKAGKAAKAGA